MWETQKKPWEDVPIEVLIEEERKKKDAQEDRREQLQIPAPYYSEENSEENSQEESEGEHAIIIKSCEISTKIYPCYFSYPLDCF